MTNFTMSNNISSMKFTLKSVPGLADVGVLHGNRDGPRPPPTVFDTEEKQLCLGKSKAQLPGRLAELCFTPGKVAFLLCQRL